MRSGSEGAIVKTLNPLLSAVGSALLSVVAIAQPANDEQFLKNAEERLARAWTEHDRAFIENLLAPEWSVTQADGSMLTRSTVLGNFFDAVPSVEETTSASATLGDFGAESARPTPLLSTLHLAGCPTQVQDSLPACPLRR